MKQKLSDNQKLSVNDAERQGFKVDYMYSGRCMYGARCPSVVIDHIGEFGTKANIVTDKMGFGYVLYCPQ